MRRPVSGAVALSLLLLGACADEKADKARAFEIAYRAGVQAIDQQNFAEAQRHLTDAAALDPDDPYVQLNLGVADQNLGQFDQARAAYQHAAATGEHLKPARVTDPHFAGRSVADLARDNLATLPPS